MTTEFPRELLAQSVDSRLAYFQSKVVAHPRLKEAHRALLHAIRQPSGAGLIFVFGPTGVGKTTLRLRVEQQLIAEALPDLAQDPGRVPVVGLEAVAPDSGNFNWKDYYTRALIALDEPLLAHKTGGERSESIDYGVRGIRRDGLGQLVIAHNVVGTELRRALEQGLRHRRPTAFIVDEAQHFKKVAGGRRLLDQMDTLKSLAGITGTVHVLVGTYELLGLADLSAQLSRRSVDIHFPRYRPDWAADITAFQSVLLTFQRHLPLREEPDLVGRYEYLYEHSVGCVGVLKQWLFRALAAALENGQETLTTADLERHVEPARKLLRLAREIQEGEAILGAGAEGQAELRRLLGLGAAGTPSGVEGTDPAAGPQPADARPPRRRGRVGQRQPTRDPVGGQAP
ncbi:MAG: ATP-binding protein [Chloroflexi bacterium]|nr:ATP-binding protein [Chloroflexota bacterium]